MEEERKKKGRIKREKRGDKEGGKEKEVGKSMKRERHRELRE
jgi:hypothetical protein